LKYWDGTGRLAGTADLLGIPAKTGEDAAGARNCNRPVLQPIPGWRVRNDESDHYHRAAPLGWDLRHPRPRPLPFSARFHRPAAPSIGRPSGGKARPFDRPTPNRLKYKAFRGGRLELAAARGKRQQM